MRGLLNINSKFGRLVFQFGQLIQLSIMWVLFCLPVFTFGPACCALFTALRKMLKEEEGRVASCFYAAFKENFKQGAIVGIVTIVLAALCIFCAFLMLAWNAFEGVVGTIAGILYLVVVVMVFTYIHYLLAYITRFQDNLKTAMYNCVYMALVHFDTTLRIAVQFFIVLLAVYYLELVQYLPIIIMLFPAVYCVLIVDPLEKVFKQYFPKEEPQEEAVEE